MLARYMVYRLNATFLYTSINVKLFIEQGTFPSMSDQNEEIPTVDICNPDAKPYLHLVKSGEISLCDFCLYIFSNKLRLYKLLHQLENIIDSGLDILHSILRHISMKKSVC